MRFTYLYLAGVGVQLIVVGKTNPGFWAFGAIYTFAWTAWTLRRSYTVRALSTCAPC